MSKINAKEALDRFDNDTDIYLDLIDAFLEMGKPDFTGMAALLAKSETDAVRQQMHKLKGGALTVGADSLGAAAGTLEAALRENRAGEENLSQLAEIASLWRETAEELKAVRESLRKQS